MLLEKGSAWIIDSVIDHIINISNNPNISNNNPIAGCSYIKLPKELGHPKRA